MPAGLYNPIRDEFESYTASFWFSKENDNFNASVVNFPQRSALTGYYDPRTFGKKNIAYSVRCVKDEEMNEE